MAKKPERGMALQVLGISHHTAPVAVRERVAIGDGQLADALSELKGYESVSEAVILSTCNRTEIYCDTDPDDSSRPLDWLLRFGELDRRELTPHVYRFDNDLAVRHVLRVACGLDSMVVGEPQILGQLKEAHRSAREAGTAGNMLDKLLQFSFRVAKSVRSESGIGSNPVSVAYAAVQLARQIHGDLNKRTALLVGAGDTINLSAMHLKSRNIGRLIIANRTLANAQKVAERYGGEAIAITDIPGMIETADIIISSTGSRLPIVTRGMIEAALKARRRTPMFLVDLAVPRDIEASTAELGDAYLFTVDDLKSVIDDNLKQREAAAERADEMVSAFVQEYAQYQQSLASVDVIKSVRDDAQAQRDAVLQRAQRQLAAGKDPAAVLEQSLNTLTNKLLHAPTSSLRDAENAADSELLEFARRLYGIDRLPPDA